MKKILFFAAAAVAMLTGCSQNDDLTAPKVAQNQEQTPVDFGTYVSKGAATRAGSAGTITTAELLKNKGGFGVFAYMKGSNGATDCYTTGTWNAATPNFMYNQLVAGAGDPITWSYTPIKYWPNDFATGNVDNKTGDGETNNAQGSVAAGKVSFFAYAPYTEVTPSTGAPTSAYSPDYGITALTGNTATTEPKVTYKFKYTSTSPYDYTTVAADNIDLLWGMRGSTEVYNLANGGTSAALGADGYNIDLTKQTTGEKINFLFKHALAKIGGAAGLKVMLDVDNNAAGALDSKSNVSIQSIVIEGVEDKIATTGVFNIAKGEWESPALDTDYEQTTLLNITDATSGVDPDIFTAANASYEFNSGTSAWEHHGVTNVAQPIFISGTPAEFYLIPGVADQQIKVTITYQVRTYDTNVSGNYVTVDQTISNIVTLPALAVNHYYTLIMHLGLTSVKFEASVTEWETDGTGEEKKIWLPSNVVTAP